MGLLLMAMGTVAPSPSLANESNPKEDLQPTPPSIVFSDPETFDPDTHRAIAREIDGSFADLNKVILARERLVFRYGLVSIPYLRHTLNRSSASRTHGWNAALTLGAMRDSYGPTPELRTAFPDLLRVVRSTSSEPHRLAFGALAFGCFPWNDGARIVPLISGDSDGPVPGPARDLGTAKERLAQARAKLLLLSNDPFEFLSVAATVAIAKSGGPDLRESYLALKISEDESVARTQARLLASALLRADDPARYLDHIRREHQQSVVAAACLALGIAVTVEDPPSWARDKLTERKLVKILTRNVNVRQPREGAQSVFARGAIAIEGGLGDDAWRPIRDLAMTSSTESEVVEAAAQVLLFCKQRWLKDELVRRARETPTVVKDPVIALALLKSGSAGTRAGVEACIEWLRSESRRPTPGETWDPRWYAVIGLLRAFHAERIQQVELRTATVDALEFAARKTLHKDALLTRELRRVLDSQKGRLASAKVYSLDTHLLRAVEKSVDCPFGLLSGDIVDVSVHRLNAMMSDLFRLGSIVPSKQGVPQTKQQPERYLKRYLQKYPYFSRLHFLRDRGIRSAPSSEADASWVLNR